AGGRTRVGHRRRRPRRGPRHGADATMITWRVPALVAALGLTLAFWPWPWTAALVIVVLALLLAAVDLAMAAPLRDVRLERDGDRIMWLDATATVVVTLHNDSPRQLRTVVRCAWWSPAV